MRSVFFISSMVLSMAATFSISAQTENKQPSYFIAETNSLKATVKDIDYDKRQITLKGPQGNTVKLKVGEEAKNFRQIHKGDEVVADYYESLAVNLAKPGEIKSGATQGSAVLAAPAGQKPARVEVETTEITASVEEVDRDKHEVTLKGPQGNKVTIKVDPSVASLESIKSGDEITMTYTEALAVSVQKAEK